MKTRVALLDLSGTQTAVLPVKAEVADDIDRAKATIIKYKTHFPKHTLVLMGTGLRPVFVGKADLAHQLDAMGDEALPWINVELVPGGIKEV
jgi:hypothetical protein